MSDLATIFWKGFHLSHLVVVRAREDFIAKKKKKSLSGPSFSSGQIWTTFLPEGAGQNWPNNKAKVKEKRLWPEWQVDYCKLEKMMMPIFTILGTFSPCCTMATLPAKTALGPLNSNCFIWLMQSTLFKIWLPTLVHGKEHSRGIFSGLRLGSEILGRQKTLLFHVLWGSFLSLISCSMIKSMLHNF